MKRHMKIKRHMKKAYENKKRHIIMKIIKDKEQL